MLATNVGGLDRILRIIVGAALVALALGALPGFAPSRWGWIGLIPLVTGFFGTCPLYSILGVSSCAKAKT